MKNPQIIEEAKPLSPPWFDHVYTVTTFGLDYDGTVTRDVETWLKIVTLLKAAGHKVYLVTMRYPSELDDPINPVDMRLRSLVDGMYFTSRQAKGPFMEAHSIKVNVWIDDNPKAIHMSAKEIWGTEHPEGFTHIPERDEVKEQ